MKKINLREMLQRELDRIYHNATLKSNLTCESDFESDLVDSMVREHCEDAIYDLKFTCPEILKYGKVYQYGRGGRTLAPERLIDLRGFSWKIKSVADLELDAREAKALYKTLKKFNDLVEEFCASIVDHCIEDAREHYADEIEAHAGKKRQHFSGVRYL